jgi:hypothetical protein
MNAKQVQTALERYYRPISKYVLNNTYIFNGNYGETDMLIVKNSGMVYDVEIKISRADFQCDFKKVGKHTQLQHGYWEYTDPRRTIRRGPDRVPLRDDDGRLLFDEDPITHRYDTTDRPHRFYFAVPADLVQPGEVPLYAGLLYIHPSGAVEKVREAKLLHKDKLDLDARLCKKFYFKWLYALGLPTPESENPE